MTLTLNRNNYLQLLDSIKIIPKIIETQIEYEEYLAVVEKLISLKDRRTAEENVLFQLLVKLIEDYEENTYQLENWSNLSPHEILQHLLESSGKKDDDLVGIISDSKKVVTSIINGKEPINKVQAQNLGEYFNVSPSLFL